MPLRCLVHACAQIVFGRLLFLELLQPDLALGQHILLGRDIAGISFDLGLESEWVAHENLLLGHQALVLELGAVVAAGAPTVTRTVSVVLEALTVELQAARV